VPDSLHRLAEERSLALHRVIAARVAADPGLVAAARERLERFARDGALCGGYAQIWRELLDGPVERLTEALVDETERGRALRQATPFTFVVGPRERWRIWRDVAKAHGATR
jgi:hypothetical protein